MFEFYDTIKAIKEPNIYLVSDAETGTLAVRKQVPLELIPIYERIASLSHPGLPKIHEIERLDDHALIYYDYIPGRDLAAKLAEEPCTTQEVFDHISQLCSILSLLHGENPPIIHRDIKPSNIIIGDNGALKLIDFGAARTYREGAPFDTYQIGTRGYAAPEQYGYNQSDARTDIYAVGVLLQELAESAGVEKRFAPIIAKCTHIYPKKRFSSSRQLLHALKRSSNKCTLIAVFAGICSVLAVLLLLVLPGKHAEESIASPSPILPAVQEAPAATPSPTAKPLPTETPVPTPVPTPTPTPAMPVLDRLPFLPGASKVYAREFKESPIVYTLEKLEEALDTAWSDPENGYQIFFINEKILCEKDLTVPPNVELRIAQDAKLEMAPGTTFTNYGFVRIFRNGNLTIGEGSTLNGGNSTLSDHESYRNVFPSITVFEGGSIHMGLNSRITAEENTGTGPRIQLEQDGTITYEDSASVTVDPACGYQYFFIYFNAVKDAEEWDYEPFRHENGYVCKPCIPIGFPDPFAAATAFLGKYPGLRANLFLNEDIILPSGSSITVPSGTGVCIDSMLTISDGAALMMEDGSFFDFLGEEGGLTVASGGILHSHNAPIIGTGQQLTVYEGAEISEYYLTEWSHLIRFEQ